jgi:acylaminoacyl-peptidase
MTKPTKTLTRNRQAGQGKRRCITPEDMLRFRIVSDPQIAPDGSRIAFVEKCVGERNEYVSTLWMVAAEKPKTKGGPVQFTSGGKDDSPRWSPEGSRIAFIRTANGQKQIYLIDARGGEARQLSRFSEGSIGSFRWSPDGRQIAVSFRPNDPQRTEEARRDRRERGLSDPPLATESLLYRCDGDGYFGSRRYGLYLVEVCEDDGPHPLPLSQKRARGAAHRLLYGEDTLGEFSFDFSPDSRQLVVATNRQPEPTLHPEKDELLRIDAATGRAVRIPGLPPGPKASVRWSPDGRAITYAGRIGTDPLYSTENAELFVCDAVRGGARSLTVEEDVCLRAEGIADTAAAFGDPALQFSPDGRRIYMRLSVYGESHVASVAVRGGRLMFHACGPLDVRMGNLSADGQRMALTVGSALKPAEVAVLDCGAAVPAARKVDGVGRQAATMSTRCPPYHKLAKPRMLTDLNGPLLAELELATPESHWIKAEDGHRVQVWVMLPRVRQAGKPDLRRVPALLEIHGGPHAQYCSTFFHEFQVLAAAGYAVFYSNPRGSKGYGRDHCAAIRGRWGTADWTDMQAVIAFMKKQSFVDSRRMGVIGGSYGGYMTNWVISHCHDFAAAVTDRSISNLVSFSGSTDLMEPVSHYFPGTFWDQPEARWDQSPMKYLGNVRTPTLIIHSEGDLRCNIEQSEQLFAALKLLGVPARFVRYPANTSHGMSRSGPPDLRIDRLHQILEWWRKYLGRPASRSRNGKS